MLKFILMILCCCSLGLNSAFASVLKIQPTQILLSEAQPISVLTISNSGDPTMLQLQLLRWSQHNGRDVYRPVDDILVTPPVFDLGRGRFQVIRFAVMKKQNPSVQQTYRVIIREVPSPRLAKKLFKNQVNVLLQLSIPLFVQPSVLMSRYLWKLKRLNAHQAELSLENLGNVTLFTNAWELLTANKHALAKNKKTLFCYLLPHQRAHWVIELTKQSTGPLFIDAMINHAKVHVSLKWTQ